MMMVTTVFLFIKKTGERESERREKRRLIPLISLFKGVRTSWFAFSFVVVCLAEGEKMNFFPFLLSFAFLFLFLYY